MTQPLRCSHTQASASGDKPQLQHMLLDVVLHDRDSPEVAFDL